MGTEYQRVFCNDPAPDSVTIDGKSYKPLFYHRLFGISHRVHHVLDYVHDGKHVYYIKNHQRVVWIKNCDLESFQPLGFAVAKDKHRAYHRSLAFEVDDVASFHLIHDEIDLYATHDHIYDIDGKKLNRTDVDIQTFCVVELSQEERVQAWKSYNDYLRGMGLEELPFEKSTRYTPYSFDKRALYRNIAGSLIEIKGPGYKNMLERLEPYPQCRDYSWYPEWVRRWTKSQSRENGLG